VQTVELLILLLISLAGFGLLARKLQLAEPIVLVLGGLAVSLIPGGTTQIRTGLARLARRRAFQGLGSEL